MGNLDRFGEPLIDNTDDDASPHVCHGGWLDVDAARPCPACRPWHAPCKACGTPPRACRSEPARRCCEQCSHRVPSIRKARP